MEIVGIDHVALHVTDLGRMVDFYEKVLGCQLERRQDELGLVHLRAGSALVDLIDIAGRLGRAAGDTTGATAGATTANLNHMCLRVAAFDLEEVRRQLERHGVEVGEIRERYGSTGSVTSIYLRDPEGNGLELRG